MRYLAVIKYKGTNYCGWQSQVESKLPSIQGEIERVLSKLLNTDIKVYASGRTDAGVHALGQTFHFDSPKEIDPYKFIHGFNELTPADLVLLSLEKVSDDFHARFKAKSKTYLYKIEFDKVANPFNDGLTLQLKSPLDIGKMKEASKVFVGEHNFMNFTSKEVDDSNYVRFIESISFIENKNILEIRFTGNGFMRYMVRMLVGALIQVGLAKLSKEDVEKILNNNDRKVCSYKAPADGLYLEKVSY